MGLRINTNVLALNAQRNLGISRRAMQSSMERLSSGYRINRASDDAAGLAISENLKAQIRSMRQANRNAQDGISMVQTAEGSLNEIQNILVRLRELSMRSASDTIGDNERGLIDIEFQQLKEEVERVAKVTNFNGTKLIDGSGPELHFQIGTNNDPVLDRITFNTSNSAVKLSDLGLEAEQALTREGAQTSLEKIDAAIGKVSGIRADLGALQNRLQSTVANLENSEENVSAANSRIRDVDVASETAELTRNSIMTQASVSVLQQANQSNMMALKLLE